MTLRVCFVASRNYRVFCFGHPPKRAFSLTEYIYPDLHAELAFASRLPVWYTNFLSPYAWSARRCSHPLCLPLSPLHSCVRTNDHGCWGQHRFGLVRKIRDITLSPEALEKNAVVLPLSHCEANPQQQHPVLKWEGIQDAAWLTGPLLCMPSDLDFQILQKLQWQGLKVIQSPLQFLLSPQKCNSLHLDFYCLIKIFILGYRFFEGKTWLHFGVILYKVPFFVREGKEKEKQSRCELKGIGLTQPISTLPDHSHRTQSIMTFLTVYVYVNITFLSHLIRSWSFLPQELSQPLLTFLCPSAHMKLCSLLHS